MLGDNRPVRILLGNPKEPRSHFECDFDIRYPVADSCTTLQVSRCQLHEEMRALGFLKVAGPGRLQQPHGSHVGFILKTG